MDPLQKLIETPLTDDELDEIEHGPWWSGHLVSPIIVRLVMTCRLERTRADNAVADLRE